MVDIVVRGGSGVPEGSYISVRVGDVRRQMHFKPGSRFRFDSGAAAMRNFTLDIFEKVGSAQVGFGELPTIDAVGRKEGNVEVARKDGSSMKLDLELAPLGSCELEAPVQEPVETPQAFKSLKQQAASQARGYLQGHSVQRLLHSMVQRLLEEQPEDPILFMIRYLEDARSAAVSRATAAPAPARSKPEEPPPEVAGREEEADLRERPPPTNAMVRAVEEDAAQASASFLARGSPCEKQLASLAESPMEDRSSATEDDEGFPVDTCPETLPDLESHHSIAATVLRNNPSAYQTLRNVRTAGGVSLARCIKPGMDVHGHPLLPTVGVVAGDADCYDVFAKLFDPIISELHCREDLDGMRHPHDLDLGKVLGVPIDESGKHVVRVRIRANRNLSAMRMAPALSFRERREVERLFAGALVSLEGELSGSYHPLSGSDSWRSPGLMAEEEAWLRKTKLLFEEPDSDIAVASGLDRDWPDARGLFLSENRRFIAWVNEEDHVSFTALDPGGDVKKAFSLIRVGQRALEDSLAAAGHSFAFSERLGFLGVNPAKLGTCLAVAAALWIPKLGENGAALTALCQELGVRVRPMLEQRGSLRSKHECFEVFLQDLIGTSEVDQVNSVIEASRALVKLEKRLQAGEHINLEDPSGALGRRRSQVLISLAKHDTPPPETVQADLAKGGVAAGRPSMVTSMKSFESVASSIGEPPEELPDLRRFHSLLSDVLEKDPSLYPRLRNVRTRSGVSLARCIKPGMDVSGHPLIKTVGVVAGDAECYEAFREILKPVAVAAHPGWSPEALQPSSLDCTTVSSLQLHSSQASVLRARVSVRRNLAGVRFPLACSPGERLEVDRLFRRATGQLAGALAGQYHELQGVTRELEKELMREGLFLEEPDSVLAVTAGLCRGWPEARGLFVSQSRELVAWINEEEHLRLWSTDGSGDLKAAFHRLCLAEGTLRGALQQEGHSFARHPHLGYLTTCPGQLGTALLAEVRVQLPFVGAQPGFRAFCQRLGIRAVTANASGGAWDVSNAETLGTGEAEQVNIVQEAVRSLVELDGRLRQGEQVDFGDVVVRGKGN